MRAGSALLATLTGVAVTESITWYDVLGVSAGADAYTVRDAYAQRSRQLHPALLSGAPSPVVSAAERARTAVEAAWLVLSDPGRRRRYDREVGVNRGGGLRGSSVFGGPDSGSPDSGGPASAGWPGELESGGGSDLVPDVKVPAVEAILGVLAVWATPQPAARSRRVTVPELRGLFFRACRDVVTTAGLRLVVQRLTPDPMPVEGLIVGQSEQPGSLLRRKSTLTVQVWHPPRHLPGTRPADPGTSGRPRH